MDHLAAWTTGLTTAGHAGGIPAHVCDIALEPSAYSKVIGGRFRSGPLAGRTVNLKWYLKRENPVDTTEAVELDHHLVLSGPKATTRDPRSIRVGRSDRVYLFEAGKLLI